MTTQLLLVAAALPVVVGLVLVLLRAPLTLTLPVYAALIPVGSSISAGPTAFGSLSSLTGLLLAGGLVLQLARGRAGRHSVSPTLPLWLLLWGVTGATVLWSVQPKVTASTFLVLGSLVLLYVLLGVVAVDRRVISRVGTGLIIGGVGSCCFGLFQLLVLGGFPTSVQGIARFGNGLLGPDSQAASLMLPIAIAAARCAGAPTRAVRWRNAAAAGVMLIGLLLTGSRGGLLALVATLIVVVVLQPQGRGVLLRYGAAALVILALVFTAHPGGLGTRQTQAADSSGRTDIWRVGASACTSYCLSGSGWGTFPKVYQDRLVQTPDAQVIRKDAAFQPHNIWLLVTIEAGVTGLALLMLGLGFTIRDGWRLPPDLRAPALAGLAGILVAGIFLSNFEYKFFWMTFMFIVLCRSAAVEPGGSAKGAGAHGEDRYQTV